MMNQHTLVTIARLAPWLVLAASTHNLCAGDQLEFFETRIRPVLVEHCYECHSSGAADTQGGLELDYRDGLRSGGDSGPAIVPGNPAESLLLEALRHESFEMPPTGQLPDEVITDFARWIADGAVDPRDNPPSPVEAAELAWKAKLAQRGQWWSLQAPRDSRPPEVSDPLWPEDPVDRFIRAGLDEAKMAPAPPADPRTLLRRLSFVLTGLPPKPEDVSTFLEAFHKDPDVAVEKLVDRLLASPHFGERFARHWMDVVRYTDTYGYEWDNPAKGSWEYRDYLIRAFNSDVGFDQLIREQIAGDLLPEPRVDPERGVNESLIGPMFYHMGEHRHGTSLDFNGIHQEMIDNKIDAFSKTFLGMTVACARCHDHKLDAISQADYYALAGMFMTPRWTTRAIDAPSKHAAAIAELKRLREEIRDELASAWTAQAQEGSLQATTLREWASERRATLATSQPDDIAYPLAQMPTSTIWLPTENRSATASSEATELVMEDDGAILVRGEPPESDTYMVQFTTGPGTASQLRLEALTHDNLPSGGPGRTPHGNFVLSHLRVEVRPLDDPDAGTETIQEGNSEAVGADSQREAPREITLASARADFSQDNYPVEAALDPAPQTGWAIGGITTLNVDRTARFVFAEPVELPQGGEWIVTLVQHYGSSHSLGRFRLTPGHETSTPGTESERLAMDKEIVERWRRLASEWAPKRESRRQSNKEKFSVVTDFSTPGFPSGWITDGDGLENGYVDDATLLIALEGDKLVESFLPRGYHTHALSSKLPGAIRLPRPERLPGKFVSLQLAGGDWAGRIDVPQNAFQAEEISFLDPTAPPTWQSVTHRTLNNGVTRVLTEFATAALHPNFPPRTGLARAGSTRLPDNDDGFDKRSWFSLTEIISHDAPGTPSDTLDAFLPLYAEPEPTSAEEAWQRLSGWLSNAVDRWSEGKATQGDVRLLNWLLDGQLLPNQLELLPRVTALVEQYREVESRIEFPRSAISMDEREIEPVNYRLNIRGNVDDEGPEIPRGFLEIFGEELAVGPSHIGQSPGSGRLELAEYLAGRDNPVTARVYVNRVWQWIFGTGIAATPSDLGKLGDPPSHPEMLDWLAMRFMEEGWSTKQLVKRLVLSRTFRQSGEMDSSAVERDPDNRLWHHYPTRRLEAEAIRDSLLAVSGRLDPQLYGRPMNPPRVAEDSMKRLFSGPWDSRGRRSIYITMSIMEPPKFLVGFNLPDLKLPTGRRDQTNVPAQALLMLNDPLVTRLANHWAERLIDDERADAGERIKAMFLAALGREPTDQEQQRWIAAAMELSEPSGDLMADQQVWSEIAHTLFNMKEFIYYR